MSKPKTNDRSQAELRAELTERKALLDYHLSGLQSEFTVADVNVGGRPVLDYVREQPLVSAGVAAGVGMLAGVILGISRREAPEPSSDFELWMSAYVDDFVEEAGSRVRRGDGADSAMRKSLRKRAPVIVLEPEQATVKKEAGSVAGLLMKTALGFGVKFALDRLTQGLTGEDEIVEALTDDDPMPAPTAVPVDPQYT